MTCLLVTLFSYIKMVREIKSLQTGPVTALSISPYKLFLYPILLFVVYFPCFLYSFTILSLGKNEHVFVRGLHLFATHSVGFFNAVLYGTQMKSYYRKINEPEEDLMFSSFLSDENSDPES